MLAYGNNCGSDDCVLVKALLRECERTIAVMRELAPAVTWAGDSGVSVRHLPEARAARWGDGLIAAKMKICRWLKPVLEGQFEFVGWTPDKHLRHSRFVGLRR